MNQPGFGFDILARERGGARLGRLATPHGTIETPNFIFCGTKAALKGMTVDQARAAEAEIILANTYHLMIQPGAERVAALGGLHRMMGWDGPMLTDSGGFQIFSMGHGGVADEIKGRPSASVDGKPRAQTLTRIRESGAEFRSYLDGSKLLLTPERSVDIQRKLGADLIVQLDECTPFHVERSYTAKSMAMSHRWGDRSLAEWNRGERLSAQGAPQAMYGIVQGGVYPDLRRESTEWTASRDFFGTAIGGSLGSHKAQMYEVVAMCTPWLHPERPVHLLGIGGFGDVFAGIRLGCDTFDCVHPTRVARHGWALMKGAPNERANLRNARYREEAGPIDPGCFCPTCRTYSAGYVHHLIKAGELLGMTLLSIHNVFTMSRLMREVRVAIAEDRLDALRGEWIAEERAAA